MKLKNKVFQFYLKIDENGDTVLNKRGQSVTFVPLITAINNLLSKDLPLLTSYELSKLIKELAQKQPIYQESKLKLLEKYGKKELDEKGGETGNYKLNDVEGYTKEHNKLLEIEEDYKFNTIKIDTKSDDYKKIQISGTDLNVLTENKIIEIV